MKLGVVIVHYNTRDDLERCLESLRRCPPRCEYRVVVVDNASTEPGLPAAQAANAALALLALAELGQIEEALRLANQVASEPGAGTTFSFDVLLDRAPAADDRAAPAARRAV